MPFLIQQSDANGNFPNPTTVGNFLTCTVGAGGGIPVATGYITPTIGQISDGGSNSWAANLANNLNHQGASSSSGVALAVSWTQCTTPISGITAPVTFFTGGDTSTFAYEWGGLLAHDVDKNGNGSFSTAFENEFVYTAEAQCVPGGAFSTSYSTSAIRSSIYQGGQATLSDFETFNVGPIGSYSITISGFVIAIAMGFRTNSTAVPNGVSLTSATHTPAGRGDANRSVTGVTFASAEHAPTPAVITFPTGVHIAAAEHNPTASGDGNASTTGVSIDAEEGKPFAHTGKQGFNPRWVSH